MKLIEKKQPTEATYIVELTQCEIDLFRAYVGSSNSKSLRDHVPTEAALYELLCSLSTHTLAAEGRADVIHIKPRNQV